MSEGTIRAPFTMDQVASLNGYQDCGAYHPFTCGGCNNRDGLVATESGWTCPTCDYTQDWAHLFMADWSWKKASDAQAAYLKSLRGV